MNENESGAAFEAAADDGLPDAAEMESAEADAFTPAPEPRRPSAQARIDAVTRARREAERERDYWRERAQAPAGPMAEATDDAPPPARISDARDVAEDDGRIEHDALMAQARAQARAELIEAATAYEAQARAEATARAWDGRQADFAAARPDYAQAVLGRAWACSEVMADAIQDSETGPQLAYHLASNPDAAAAIAAMSPLAQVRALGRIEAALEARAGAGPTVSSAPAPPPSIRGAGGRFRPAADTDDFAAFDRAYGK